MLFKRPLQRVSKPAQSPGVKIAVPVPHSRFVPTPSMSPAEIAYRLGRGARQSKSGSNPYVGKNAHLAAEWLRGYGDDK